MGTIGNSIIRFENDIDKKADQRPEIGRKPKIMGIRKYVISLEISTAVGPCQEEFLRIMVAQVFQFSLDLRPTEQVCQAETRLTVYWLFHFNGCASCWTTLPSGSRVDV